MEKIALFEHTNETGFIEPSQVVKPIDMPSKVLLIFFGDVIEKLVEQNKVTEIASLKAENARFPLYKLKDKDMCVIPMGVGAPLAAGILEEVIALGGKTFLALGGAGVLNNYEVGHIIVPTSCVRDEGTSFHYMEPSRYISLDQKITSQVIQYLEAQHITFTEGRTWTTDAFYRETKSKVETRKKEGCVCVEMECSAFTAVAKYRSVNFAQLLYAGDSLSADVWDGRTWHTREELRYQLFELASDVLMNIKE